MSDQVAGSSKLFIAHLLLAGALLFAGAVFLLSSGPLFRWEREVIEMPAAELAIGLLICGLVYGATLLRLRRELRLDGAIGGARLPLIIVIMVGLVCRLFLLPSTPALEDDSYRYLWDGGVSAHGINPYAVSPQDAQLADHDTTLAALRDEAGVILERVNHPHLKTIYPPVAQAMFALAHIAGPWSLLAWRLVCLAAELATLLFLFQLLDRLGRSRLWSLAYWWNPIVIKEMINSAHMEAILLPLVLGAILLSISRRHFAAIGVLGLAIGTKLWPVLLAPLLLAPLRRDAGPLILAVLVLATMILAWLIPPLMGGLDTSSGFVAYANYWQTNSALMRLLPQLIGPVVEAATGSTEMTGLVVRGGLGLAVAWWSLWLAWRASGNGEDTMLRAALVVCALVLLSPAQFPWYMTWLAPFLCVLPSIGLLAITPLVSLYYLSFHFEARGIETGIADGLVWMIWVPVWLLLAWEARRAWRRGLFPIERNE